MALPNSNPFYGSSGNSIPVNGGTQSLALDNLLRRELKIGDPNDPAQVAQALLSRYKNDPRANAISQEAKGLPFLLGPASAPQLLQQATSSSAELQQAIDDVERDLQELLSDALLKDVKPEIQGWAQAVRSAIQEGSASARFALDPNQRDKTFAIRRQLNDYARMARLVGALTPAMNQYYRKFAQSLDEVAGVLLVLMGEALSSVGFNGGRFLLQAPYTELQSRRDAAIYALRNLVGATQQAYGPNDWPRGLDAYRTLFRILEEQGQGDLRSLLSEVELSRIMDELIQRAAHGNADGLRALGATALLDLQRFRRLVYIGQFAVSPESPPLSAFLEALQLFADAFKSSGGFRLMRISRPPILFYGLYGNAGDDSDRRLLQIIINRGLLADQLDCLAACGGCDGATDQAVLDKILYDVDRAIDLYAMGQFDFGQPERRAAAYSFVIEQYLPAIAPQSSISKYLNEINDNLRPSLLGNSDAAGVFSDISSFALTIISKLNYYNGNNPSAHDVETALDGLTPNLESLMDFYLLLLKAQAWLLNVNYSLAMPDSVNSFLSIFNQELLIQKDVETRWENLVRTLAPNCEGIKEVLNGIGEVIDGALSRVGIGGYREFKPSIPPHYETSLDSLVDDVDRMGRGRPTI